MTSQSSKSISDFEQDERQIGNLGCWQTFRFFLKHSWRDIGRRKCHFCLALCSVLIVVLATLVVNTIIGKGPIIFMKLAQEDSGEIDGIFIAGDGTYVPNSNSFWDDSSALNYTLATELLEENEIEHHISPRYEICPVDMKDYEGNYLASKDSMCLKFIDTD